jgi:hypothetical protein
MCPPSDRLDDKVFRSATRHVQRCADVIASVVGSVSGPTETRDTAPRPDSNAIHDNLPDIVAVLDAFDVVRLGVQVVDEVWHRVQQHILGLHGHRHDPLYKIRACFATVLNT